jgi:hypothetical protein
MRYFIEAKPSRGVGFLCVEGKPLATGGGRREWHIGARRRRRGQGACDHDRRGAIFWNQTQLSLSSRAGERHWQASAIVGGDAYLD